MNSFDVSIQIPFLRKFLPQFLHLYGLFSFITWLDVSILFHYLDKTSVTNDIFQWLLSFMN